MEAFGCKSDKINAIDSICNSAPPTFNKENLGGKETHPKVVIVTMVYQNAAGIEVKFVPSTFFSA